jgi:DNA-binding beta-propeller fold protein YncE
MRVAAFIGLLALLPGCGQPTQDGIECAAWTSAPSAGSARSWPPSRPGYQSPIAGENALPGNPDWRGTDIAFDKIEGYTSLISAHTGDEVSVMMRADKSRTVHWSVYRIGWYGGAGARLIVDGDDVPAQEQPACPRDPRTSAISCAWPPAFSFGVGADWVSGLYLVRLDADTLSQWLPLVITDDRPADLLVQLPVTTWQAYNSWGGESLYTDASGTMPNGAAVRVSFDRPYTFTIDWTILDREVHFIRFAEKYGYDVTYTTNLDVAAGGWEKIFERGAFVDIGHDEYWSKRERNAVEAARDLGVPILFFGANDAYYKTRWDEPPMQRPRSFTCYKLGVDPVAGDDATGIYRMQKRPESGLIGEMYDSWVYRNFSWVVSNEHHWLFEGTGLHNGDSIPLLVGDEYDRTSVACAPENLQVAARSPVVDSSGRPRVAETLSWHAASGALVFAAGTIDWVDGLGSERMYDPRVERMTANVLKAALGLQVPDGVGQADPTPPPESTFVDPALWVETELDGLTGPAGVAALPDGSMVVSEPDLDRVIAVGKAPQRQLSILADHDTVFGVHVEHPLGLRNPTALTSDEKGNIYIADTGNGCIRKIANDPKHSMSTVAGVPGSLGFGDGSGDRARFSQPMGLAIDSAHATLYVADTGNNRVRAIDTTTGRVRTIAGSVKGYDDGPGATATFHAPTALALAPDGRLFVICSGQNGRVAVIGTDAARTVTTLMTGRDGAVDGDGKSAGMGAQGGAAWKDGVLLVSDPQNYLVRAIAPGADAASTQVATLAGSKRFGRNDADVTDASFGLPLGLSVTPDGGLLVADGHNGSIRIVH